jgi:hypothetical protein
MGLDLARLRQAMMRLSGLRASTKARHDVVEFIGFNDIDFITDLPLFMVATISPAHDLEERPLAFAKFRRHLDTKKLDHRHRKAHRFDLLRQITHGYFATGRAGRKRQGFASIRIEQIQELRPFPRAARLAVETDRPG